MWWRLFLFIPATTRLRLDSYGSDPFVLCVTFQILFQFLLCRLRIIFLEIMPWTLTVRIDCPERKSDHFSPMMVSFSLQFSDQRLMPFSLSENIANMHCTCCAEWAVWSHLCAWVDKKEWTLAAVQTAVQGN